MGASISERIALVATGLLLAGCQPDLGSRASSVSGLRLLAVAADPPEAAPGTMVSYQALLVDQSGERADLSIDWAFCNAQKPLSDLDDISSSCFTFNQSFLVPLGQGPTATGALPSLGCALFGPDVPPSMPGMPPGRPTDPDPTGGYYQPVRLILQTGMDTVLGAGESRLVCGLPGATPDVLSAFKAAYKPNTNPQITGVSAGGMPLAPDDGMSPGMSVKAGEKVTLSASWPSCNKGEECGGAETYAYYDPDTRDVTEKEEQITISWFATAGTFATDRSAAPDGGAATASEDVWTAPNKAGIVLVWAVIRDDRGGVSWQRYRLDVQ